MEVVGPAFFKSSAKRLAAVAYYQHVTLERESFKAKQILALVICYSFMAARRRSRPCVFIL